MTIKVLDEISINKISAGEVVERPLNVVKELLENALDAGANTISVEIEKSGKRLIRVCDNGIGMSKEDLIACIKRHATSKISSFDDLANINSLGFRGEALPSIAAVSMLDIKTQLQKENSGWELKLEADKQQDLSPWAGSGGTIVEVRNLFFNTPVREKFLKSDTTEKAKIISCIDEIALVRNDINFKVVSDGKQISNYQKTDSKLKRIEDVLGKNVSNTLKHIHFDHPQISIDAYITKREHSLPQRSLQYLFVNGRCVNYPKWLYSAISQGAKSAIPIGRHIGIIMFLTTNPDQIDINIHPTKREIKFACENQMYELFSSFIRKSLEEDSPSNLIESEPINIKEPIEQTNIGNINNFHKPSFSYNTKKSSSYVPSFTETMNRNQNVSIENYKNLFSSNEQPEKEEVLIQPNVIEENNFKFIGQIFITYILIEKDDVLYIIDQHAAQERVRYEMFMEQKEKNSLNIQQLLIPEVFDLSSSKTLILKDKLNYFKDLGFDIEEFGKNSFRLSSYPALLGNSVNFIEIVNTLIDYFVEEKTADIQQITDKIIRTACRSSIKAGDKIETKQAIALVKDMLACKMPWTCPHGRPTVYKLSNKDLQKYFKRV